MAYVLWGVYHTPLPALLLILYTRGSQIRAFFLMPLSQLKPRQS